MASREHIEAELVTLVPQLRAFARTFHRDAARADDLVQETVLKAWSNAEKFREGTSLKAWMFTILRNTFLSERRKMVREVEDVDGYHAGNLSERPRHDDKLQFQDFAEALSQLSDDHREALVLVGAAGFSYEEVAEICGCAVGTVKSRVNRARARLAELMRLETDAVARQFGGGNDLIDAAMQPGPATTALSA